MRTAFTGENHKYRGAWLPFKKWVFIQREGKRMVCAYGGCFNFQETDRRGDEGLFWVPLHAQYCDREL